MFIEIPHLIFLIFMENMNIEGCLIQLQFLPGRAVRIIDLKRYQVISAVCVLTNRKAVIQRYCLIDRNFFKHPVIIHIIDLKRKLVRVRICHNTGFDIVHSSRTVIAHIDRKIADFRVSPHRRALSFSQNKIIGLDLIIVIIIGRSRFGDPEL